MLWFQKLSYKGYTDKYKETSYREIRKTREERYILIIVPAKA